jgi:hypothetical protein
MRFPLSQSQQGIYYVCVASSGTPINYQNPVLFDLPSDLDLEKVRSAVYDALCAHPSLASRIVVDEEGTPWVESGGFLSKEEAVPVVKVRTLDEVEPAPGAAMDIHGERLYRCAVYQGAEGKSWLYVDFHHVLCDGFSLVLMLREIERCFNGKKPAGEWVDGGTIAQEEEALRADEARMAEEATGIRTIAGRDLMVMDVGETIEFSDAEVKEGEWYPDWFPRKNHPRSTS